MDSDPEISKRLLYFIQYLGIELKYFAYICGISKANILSGRLTNNSFIKIGLAYPKLNLRWLRFGEGAMLCQAIEDKVSSTNKRKSKSSFNGIPENVSKSKIERKSHSGKKTRPIRDRLRLFISFLKLSSSEFAKTLEVPESRVSKIDEAPDELLDELLNIICLKYPTINPEWLEFGIGDMLLKESEITTITDGMQRFNDCNIGSVGYKWALGKVLNGFPRKEIIREFNKRHDQDPHNYSTRTGKPLSDAILSVWIRDSGITPPAINKPNPYKKSYSKDDESDVSHQMTVQDILLSIKKHSSLQDILASIIAYKYRQSDVAYLSLCEPKPTCKEELPLAKRTENIVEKAICISVGIDKATIRHSKTPKPIGFKWVIKRAKEGTSRDDIIREFNEKHLENPEKFSTRKGKPLNEEILNIWLKRAGITLNSETPNSKIPICANFQKGSVGQPASVDTDIEREPTKKKKSFNPDILKPILIALGAIGGVFLLVWIIVEFVFPAIFIGMLFLSMLFAKK